MLRLSPQIHVRLTPDLREWITDKAKSNLRSINSELVHLIIVAKQLDEKRVKARNARARN